MSFYKDLVACLVFEPSPYFDRLRNKTLVLSELVSRSMSTTSCNGAETESECRDQGEALRLKMVALGVILVAGVFGVALPLLGKKQRFLRTDGNVFVITKAFAAGVILATGFVHMLPDGSESLTDSCLPENPWSKFPFSSFIAMIAALCTLLVDFLATQFYEQKHEKEQVRDRQRENLPELLPESVVAIEAGANGRDNSGKGVGEEDGGGDHMHIVGMHAHAAAHRHSHPHGHHACGDSTHAHVNKHVGHAHTPFGSETESSHMRHAVVSQVLELGIVSHSVIIGLSLGVSQSPCTIRPLIAALSFHQFFEGFALGGCISQAQFKTFSASLMACFFAITTPAGIAVGTAVSSVYNPDSPRALVVEGVFDSISAGILIYMALVDLIAADFLSKRMSCNVRLQVASYFALFLGAGLMSALAIWA